MDPHDQDETSHLAALCNRLGSLWSEQEIDVWEESPSLEKLDECHRTLVGKIFTNSPINLQAFQTTMRIAWRTD